MGALAPPTHWIAEDDRLLKNAVEAGASLESLAKGAVCFSRQFTIQELQDRWRSLLYDNDISLEVSARILDIEQSALCSSKSNKSHSFKGKELNSGKRKFQSLRSHYNAIRKRVCNEPCHYPGLDFSMPPGRYVLNGNGGFVEGPRQDKDCFFYRNFIVDPKLSEDYHISGAQFGNEEDAYSEMPSFCPDRSTAHGDAQDFGVDHVVSVAGTFGYAYQTDCMDFLEHKLQDGNSSREGVHEQAQNVDVEVNEAENNLPYSYGTRIGLGEIPNICEETNSTFQSCSTVQEIVPPSISLNEIKGTIVESPYGVDKPEIVCINSEGNENFNSEAIDHSSSIQKPEYSTSMQEPFLEIAAENSTSPLLIAQTFEGKEEVLGTSLLPLIDVKEICSVAHDGDTLGPNLHNEACKCGVDVDKECDFVNMPLNFTKEGDPFFEGDGKDFDGFNSFLIGSPTEHLLDHQHISQNALIFPVSDTCNVVFEVHVEESCGIDAQVSCAHGDRGDSKTDDLEDCMPGTSVEVVSSSVPIECSVYCVLNTEDPEVPCNDDVIIPSSAHTLCSPTKLEPTFEETTEYYNSTITCLDEMEGVAVDAADEDQKKSELFLSSSKHGQTGNVQVYSTQPFVCRMNAKLQRVSLDGRIQNRCDGKNSWNISSVSSFSSSVTPFNEDVAASGTRNFVRPISFSVDTRNGGPFHDTVFPKNVVDCEEELKTDGFPEDCPPSHIVMDAGQVEFEEQLMVASNSDVGEKNSDGETDLPTFSEIESMILDLDLCPYDQEPISCAREVSRYQYLETKRTILRLEQGATSCMQRAIASHKAVAVFYGLRLKHYIRKPKVLIGRATEEVYVDIDLQREGRANKISRRQAILEMDENGKFTIKNVGKFPVQINGVEVLRGECYSLSSGCSIEIRDMAFIFEVNWHSVRQYLSSSLRRKNKAQTSKFDWSQADA